MPNRTPLRLTIALPHLRFGGIERGTVKLLPHLADHGIEARLLLRHRTGDLLREVPEGIPVADMGGARSALSLRRLARAFEGADVVYTATNAMNVAVLAALRLLPAARRPALAISEHTSARDYLAEAKAGWLRKGLVRALYPRADLLIAPLPGLGEGWLTALSLPGPRVAVVPNPILSVADIAFARRVRVGDGPERDPDLVVSMGRLHPAKGHDRIVDALAEALRARPSLKLEIWGAGDEAAALAGRIAASGIDDRARLRGPTDDPLGVLARAGLLAMGSRREGFGNIAVEAFAVGTPVLATDCDGPRAILSGTGAAGRIAPGETALAAGLAEMTGDPAALRAARTAGAALTETYSTAKAAERFAKAIRALAPGKGEAHETLLDIPISEAREDAGENEREV